VTVRPKRVALAALCIVLLCVATVPARAPAALGAPAAARAPAAAVSDAAVSKAIRRALNFVYRSALVPANFRENGDDYIWCFFTIANTAGDPVLARTARAMGRERARAWRRTHRAVSPKATADEIADTISGALGAELLGVPDDSLKAQLRTASRRFTAKDYLRFDPALEPPRSDVPACERCTRTSSRYEIFLSALVVTYFGDTYGIRLGAPYRAVLRWLPRMRPYPAASNDEFGDAFFAVSHVVYTLNDYGAKRVAPQLLPDEVALLRRGLAAGIAQRDAETVGEGLDTLKAFGLRRDEPLIGRGIAHLVASQRRDGSWGDSNDAYARYHSAWTGIDGLRSYRFRSEVRRLPEVPRA
jgi:hypothetical protein